MLAPLLATLFGGFEPSGRLVVFAAASLSAPFTEISRSFETRHRGVRVVLSFAGSNTLAAQIQHGAPADVFASAAAKNLEQIEFDKGTRRTFARNLLQIALRPGLKGIDGLVDLKKIDRLVVADRAVPVGAYTEAFFDKAARRFGESWRSQVEARIVSREADVKAVLAKVSLGEADAGIVYASDVTTSKGKVRAIPIPGHLNVRVDYPIAVPKSASSPSLGRDFIRHLLSDKSQATLARYGFVRAIPATKAAGTISMSRG